jgi:Na+-translocating ferredoxin:NAD+ oxidoreductase RNF subunit RnfB
VIDTVVPVGQAVAGLGGLALVASVGLGVAARKFYVPTDPKIEEIDRVLPQANCGACGFPGCKPFATAVAKGDAETNGCPVGGQETAVAVGRVMGLEVAAGESDPVVAVVYCAGGTHNASDRMSYAGPTDCRALALLGGGQKDCSFACVGLGTCELECPFDAIHMNEYMLPVVDYTRCTGCNICAEVCPKNVIDMVPISQDFHIVCSSHDKGKITKSVCTVGCIACNKCVKVCPTKSITISDDLAVIDYKTCENCGDCVEVCPTDIIVNFSHRRKQAVELEALLAAA